MSAFAITPLPAQVVGANTPTPVAKNVNVPTRMHTAALDAAASDPEARKKLHQLEEAARGFEQLFVQQMLKTANFASKVSKGGYGAMAPDAMASSVTRGGGMGLAALIRDSMIQTQLPELAPALQTPKPSSPAPGLGNR